MFPLELNKHVWMYPEWFCPVLFPSISITTNLATGTILIIALERFLGVVKPYWKQLDMRRVNIALIVVWGWSIITVIPNILHLRLNTGEYVWCGEFWDGYEDLQKAYGISFFFVAFFIPLVVITFLHGHIINRLCHPLILPEHHANAQNKDSRRVIRVLTLIVIAFAVCVSPNKILWFVYDVAPSMWNPDLYFYLRTIQILYYSRVAIDPLVYCTFDTRFKKDCIYTVKRLQGMYALESWMERQRSGSDLTRRSRALSCTSMERRLRADLQQRGSPAHKYEDVDQEMLTKDLPESKIIDNPHFAGVMFKPLDRVHNTLKPIPNEDENELTFEQSKLLKDIVLSNLSGNGLDAKVRG